MNTALSTVCMLGLSTLLLTAGPALAGKRAEPCPHARYRISGEPVGDAGVLEAGGIVALDGACDAVSPKRYKAKRKGTLVAARWAGCDGLGGPVRLAGTLVDGCRAFEGTLKVGKKKRRLQAVRSECGDGFVDARGGEGCDGGATCTATCVPEGDALRLVGDVDGGRALVAFVRDAYGITAYTCGVGDALPTHTGWFFGEPPSDPAELPTMTSAGGLVLAGRLDGGTARGTLALPSGDVLPWEAELARDGGGLYESEDTLALTGLIVANDGRMAGNASLRRKPQSFEREPGGRDVGSVPVSVPGGKPPLGSPTVVVTFPVADVVRTLPLAPVVDSRKTVSRRSPTVIFLVHGMSDSTGTLAPDAPEDPVKCEGPRNTPFYSRCEWGIDFIPGLFGLDENKAGSLFNLAGQDVSGMRYIAEPANRPLIDENVGITARNGLGCVTDPAAVETYDARAAAHFVTAEKPDPRRPPELAVFAIWRDSTRGVVESGRRVTNQAYAALRWYETQYKKTPKVIFLTQSFGGIATRFVLSNPPRTSFDTPLLNADRVTICDEERTKMDYLRDRTVYALTLATPHEGSYMAEWGLPPKQFLRRAIANLDGQLVANPLADLVRTLEDGLSAVIGEPVEFVDGVRAALAGIDGWLDTPALRDMKLATMESFNLGPLSPERARRTAGSPITGARDTLIPVYATLARSPGSHAFDSPKLVEGFEVYDSEREKEKGWILSTMFGADLMVKQFIQNGFGRVDVPPYAEFADILDRRKRIFDLSSRNDAVEALIEEAGEGVFDALSTFFTGRFGPGVDGVLAYFASLDIEVSILPNAMVPIHLDREWRLEMTAEVDVPMPALACGGQTIPIDYDVLVRALFDTFGDTAAILDGLEGASLEEVVSAALDAAGESVDLLGGVLGWLIDKLDELGDAPEGCELPLDLFEWRLTEVTGSVPAPEWVPTDNPVSDGEMDTDGPVHSASALGFTLGRRPFFFEHDREDGPVIADKPTFGSWYRLYDNPVTEKYNHGLQYQNDVALWVFEDLLAENVGPVPQVDGFSEWP
jgi:hypothetical protein